MSGFDDLFTRKPFDKEAWGQRKQTERKEVYALVDTTAASIAADGSKFRQFLDTQAKFSRYSAANALLIFAQMPQATQLKSFEHWRSGGVSIKRSQKGISILEPGESYAREDGSTGTSYNVKKVFDISQTNARNKAAPIVQHDERKLIRALIHKAPIAIETVESIEGGVGAFYDHDRDVILVLKGMSAPDIFRSVSKALAQAELAGGKGDYERGRAAFIAYCVSYLLSRQNGIDVSGYDFSQLPLELRLDDPQGVRAILTEIRDTADQISLRMQRVLSPRDKEQGR